MRKGIGEIISDAFDLFGRVWKPLALGFAFAHLVGASPMWLVSEMKERLLAQMQGESGDPLNVALKQLPALALMAGAVFLAFVAYVLAYNYAVALAQAALQAERPEDLSAVNADARKRFFPAMWTLGLYALVYLVPLCFGLLAGYGFYLAIGSRGWGLLALSFFAMLVSGVACLAFFDLSIAVPGTTGEQGAHAFRRGLRFARENWGELFVMGVLLILLGLGIGLVSLLLHAPLPSPEGGLGLSDVSSFDARKLIERALAPDVLPAWARVAGFVLDTATSVLSPSLSLCLITAWFRARSFADRQAL